MILALASAVSYGLSDYVGGLVARRVAFVRVALLGQVGGLAAACAAAPFLSSGVPSVRDLLYGALSGVGTGLAMTFLFRGMSRGAMSVVVPVSSVAGAALPVLAGAALLGERPDLRTWAGVLVVLPALWAVSRPSRAGGHPGPAIRDGLSAGVGIAVQYLALAQAHASSGLWPVAAGRVTAIAAVTAIAIVHRSGDPRLWRTIFRPIARKIVRHNRETAAALFAGVLAALALGCYLVATRTQALTPAVVLSSLYPVIPVVLGLTTLRERLGPAQAAGLAGALAGSLLIATS